MRGSFTVRRQKFSEESWAWELSLLGSAGCSLGTYFTLVEGAMGKP
jgi:hypothetical protein